MSKINWDTMKIEYPEFISMSSKAMPDAGAVPFIEYPCKDLSELLWLIEKGFPDVWEELNYDETWDRVEATMSHHGHDGAEARMVDVNSLFTWSDTCQGDEYWQDVHAQEIPNAMQTLRINTPSNSRPAHIRYWAIDSTTVIVQGFALSGKHVTIPSKRAQDIANALIRKETFRHPIINYKLVPVKTADSVIYYKILWEEAPEFKCETCGTFHTSFGEAEQCMCVILNRYL